MLARSASAQLLLCVVASLMLLVFSYWDLGANQFVWDDDAFLVEQSTIRKAENFEGLVLKPFSISSDYYRPVVVATYALQYKLQGLNSTAFHYFNWVLHFANVIMLFVLIRSLLAFRGASSFGIALGSAVLYSVHPVTIESIAWVSGRFDLLMTTFLLMALAADRFIGRESLRAAVVGLLFFLAAGSKETAVGFCLMLPVFHIFLHWLARKDMGLGEMIQVLLGHWKTYLAVIAAGLCYLYFRWLSMGYLLSGLSYNDYGDGLQRILLSAKTLITYCLMAVFPFGEISPIHFEIIPVQVSDVGAWVSLVLVAFWMVALAVFFKKMQPLVLLSFSFFLAIVPALHLFQTPLQDNLVQERYLQFPLAVGLLFGGVLIASFLQAEPRRGLAAAAMTMMFLLVSVANIRVTVPLWKDNLALWTWVTNSAPESPAGWANLAAAYQEKGYLDEAAEAAKHAVEMSARPVHKASALVTLGNVENMRGNLEGAAEYYLEGINTSKEVTGALVNMANTLIRMGEMESAKWYLDVAESVAGKQSMYLLNVGIYYIADGDKTKARGYFDRALELMDESRRQKYAVYVEDLMSGRKKIGGKA